jgi:hypothetical protein
LKRENLLSSAVALLLKSAVVCVLLAAAPAVSSAQTRPGESREPSPSTQAAGADADE